MKIAALVLVAGLAATANAQLSIVAGTTPFIDISATGTAFAGISDDSEHTLTAAALSGAGFTGNALFAATDIIVGNNGGILWGGAAAANAVGYDNTNLLTAANSNTGQFGNGNGVRQFLAPLNDDVFPGTGASVRWQVIGGTLVIQWTNQDHFSATGTGTITFQVQVPSGAAPYLASFVYSDLEFAAGSALNNGGSASIGYRANGFVPSDPTLTNSVQWSFNTANAVSTNASVNIVPTPGAAALLGLGGLIAGRRRRA